MKKNLKWKTIFLLGGLLALIGVGMFFFYNSWRSYHMGQLNVTFIEGLAPYLAPYDIGPYMATYDTWEDLPPPRIIRQEFLDLRQQYGNNNIVGHLWIEGTTIDYIVVQGSDNEFYLYHDIFHNPSVGGWIFLDYEVNLAGEDQNTVIYGHNMNDRIKFHDIRFFADYDFFRNHPIINFRTIYEDTKWEVFAFYSAHISVPYTHINLETTEQWALLQEMFHQASRFDTGIRLTPEDRVLTLSTCTNTNVDTRFVLQARLIES